MGLQPNIASAACLIADPARAAVLTALLDGQSLETLASIGPKEAVRGRGLTREAQKRQVARCCYDHLAGRLGVAVTCGLRQRGLGVAAADKQFEVAPNGMAWFGAIGLDVAKIKPSRRGLARQCLDWTERQHHLAGPLGVQVTSVLCSAGWIRRAKSSRAVEVAPNGWKWFREQFDIQEWTLLACDRQNEERRQDRL